MASKVLDSAVCNVKVSPGAVVCLECDFVGDITIGSRTVVHPRARIIAESGPIIIGEGNLIEEQAQIINRVPESQNSDEPANTLVIGNCNVFEVDSYFQASKVGDFNILESKSLSAFLMIPPYKGYRDIVSLSEGGILKNAGRKCVYPVIKPQGLQLEFLMKIFPNYHHLIKPKKKIIS